jgi:tRNA threonylcarbamoyladenosine biosynthesis protein TsaB
MFLIISTTERFKFTLGLKQKTLELFEFKTENQSNDLLPEIEKVLADKNVTLSNLRAILVNIGPGSYTGVRIGVTVANTLAWSLDIPVYGFIEGKLEETIIQAKTAKAKNFSHVILPYYENK